MWIQDANGTEVARWTRAIHTGTIGGLILGWETVDTQQGWRYHDLCRNVDTRSLIGRIDGRTRIRTTGRVEEEIVKGQRVDDNQVGCEVGRIRYAPIRVKFVNGAAKALLTRIVLTTNNGGGIVVDLTGERTACLSFDQIWTIALCTLGTILTIDTRRVFDTLIGPRTP